jgi:hypothetical protein
MRDVEFTDRYQALGLPYPDPATMCDSQCEGTGVVPVYMTPVRAARPDEVRPIEEESDPRLIALWQQAEAREAATDGWHFVTCPDCNGTRLKP